jgi:hypothetical protein
MEISHLKMGNKAMLNILNPIRMPPTTLAKDSLNDRHQSCAPSIHISPLVLWKKKRPYKSEHVDNKRHLSYR